MPADTLFTPGFRHSGQVFSLLSFPTAIFLFLTLRPYLAPYFPAIPTFFVLGKYAYLYPDLVWQIVADGHEVGNHSFFHPLFTTITPTVASQEITYTEAVIDWAVGQHVPMRYVRFPYGGRNYANRLHAASFGYQSSFWDIDPRGWDPTKTVTDVIAHVRHTAHHGGIVIMHCGSWDDANALAGVIQVIRELGMQPGTLTDVLGQADYEIPHYPKTPRQGDHVEE